MGPFDENGSRGALCFGSLFDNRSPKGSIGCVMYVSRRRLSMAEGIILRLTSECILEVI